MKAYDLFKEYIWLVQTIYRHKRITLKQINELWRETDMSGGLDFARATFVRHRNAIEDIFGIYIECDLSDGRNYYIGNSHVLEEDSVQNWLLSTLSVNNVISESLSVQDRIQIETIPDNRFLSVIIDAMKKNLKIEIQYRRFGSEELKTHRFSPYALKVYQKRWYILAYFDPYIKEDGEIREAHFTIFSFDRIENVSITKEKFQIDSDFTVKDYFRDSYGIVASDTSEAEDIVIRAYGREVFDMRTLPLHPSQEEICQKDDYSDFRLHLKPTLDFQGKILSRGGWVEVLEPRHLREEIERTLRYTLGHYAKS